MCQSVQRHPASAHDVNLVRHGVEPFRDACVAFRASAKGNGLRLQPNQRHAVGSSEARHS